MDRKKLAIGIVTLVALAALAAAGWLVLGERRAPSDENALALQGNVDIRQVSLAFDGSARIVQMAAREGDRVASGALLGRLDTRTAEARLQQARAEAGVAEQALRKLRAGSRPEEIAQAKAQVAAAQADFDLAETQWQRLSQVGRDTSGKGVSQQDVDAAAARRDATRARLGAARQAARLVEIGPRREDVAQAEAQLRAAQATQALVQRDIDESELRAPVSAVVRSRLLEPGDMASPQRPAYTLAVTQPKWVRAYLGEPDLARVREGDAATVTVDGQPGLRVPGKVGYISAVSEFTPKTVETKALRADLVYEIRVMVDDPNDALRLGMPATVHLRLAPAPARGA
jgi:HlyD family secretion protein